MRALTKQTNKQTNNNNNNKNALILIAVDIGGKNTGVEPDYNMSCPHGRSRDPHSVGRHPREVKWTVTPREGNGSDSSDSRKAFIILMF